tara:strand:- start:1161 stop:1400 length:240 start_codon:yes stop_codon:yes gene_type:complete
MDTTMKAHVVKQQFKIFFTQVTGYKYVVEANSEEEAKEKWKKEQCLTENSKVVWSGIEDVSVVEVTSDGKARDDSGNNI